MSKIPIVSKGSRFSLGELICAFLAGAVLVAYLFMSLLLFGKCVCSGPVKMDSAEASTVIQWGMAMAAWLVVMVIMSGIYRSVRNR